MEKLLVEIDTLRSVFSAVLARPVDVDNGKQQNNKERMVFICLKNM